MYTTGTVEDLKQGKHDARRKEIIAIAITLLGALLVLINYLLSWAIPSAQYFVTVAAVGALVSVYYERKYYSLKVQLEKQHFQQL